MAPRLPIRPRLHRKVNTKPIGYQRNSRFGGCPATLHPRGYVSMNPACPSPLNINFAKPKFSFVLVQLIIRFQCACVFLFQFACLFHVAYGLNESLLVLFVPTWVLHPFGFSIALVPKVSLLCPCSCCACLVNPHISLYHVAFIAVLRVFPYSSH